MHHPPSLHEEKLRGVSHLLTQLPGLGVGLLRVGGGLPLGGPQHVAKRHLEVELLWEVRWRVWQQLEHLQPRLRCPIASWYAHRRRALPAGLEFGTAQMIKVKETRSEEGRPLARISLRSGVVTATMAFTR
jgi:hypothetical protein